MKDRILLALGAVAFTTLLAIPAPAAIQKAAETQKATATTPNAWPPESLAGTIVSVVPDKRIVIVKDASGVPFDIVVNRSTRIKRGDRELRLRDLASDVNRNASIRFVPERNGDIAETIRLNG